MTHSQIRGRHGSKQVAEFLSEISRRFIVTSCRAGIYNVYVVKTAELAFSGSADDVLEFIEKTR